MFSPDPAMMPDRIGIIGNTHGVNASRRPKPKKLSSASQRLLDDRFAASACSSDCPPGLSLPPRGGGAAPPGAGEGFAAASSSADAAGISTLTAFVITG